MTEQHDPFNDPNAVAAYAEGPVRNVPGWADMLRMTELLLAERVPHDGRVLVVGAGGGLELKRFAEAHAGWSFVGVDPAREMLKLARATLGPLVSRTELHEGYVETASAGPFDGATCLLTLHFVAPAHEHFAYRRRATKAQIGHPLRLHLPGRVDGGVERFMARVDERERPRVGLEWSQHVGAPRSRPNNREQPEDDQ